MLASERIYATSAIKTTISAWLIDPHDLQTVENLITNDRVVSHTIARRCNQRSVSESSHAIIRTMPRRFFFPPFSSSCPSRILDPTKRLTRLQQRFRRRCDAEETFSVRTRALLMITTCVLLRTRRYRYGDCVCIHTIVS